MQCPFCNSSKKKSKTDVINSRQTKGGDDVWRRRRCLSCDEIFTTSEHFSYDSWFIIKRNLTRKRFVYEKLFVSILNAINTGKGRDQGDDAVHAKIITNSVIHQLFIIKSKYIATKEIIRIAHEVLGKEDAFFALRYVMYSEFRLKVIQGKK